MGNIKSKVLATAVTTSSTGADATTHIGSKLVDVGDAGDPRGIKILAVYGIATAAGKIVLYESADGEVDSDSDVVVPLYLSDTGSGLTELEGAGPINDDLYVAGDGTTTIAVRYLTVVYESIE